MLLRSRTNAATVTLIASVVATACSGAATRDPHGPRSIPITEVAASSERSIARTPAVLPMERISAAPAIAAEPLPGQPLLMIGRTADPNRVAPRGATDRVRSIAERTLERAGFPTEPLPTSDEGSQPARAEAAAAPAATGQLLRAFVVSSTVQQLDITRQGPQTTIACSVTLMIAPWSAEDQRERWEPETTAAATGSARATVSGSRAQLEIGVSDCLEGAVEAAATREVIPFLRRVAIRD
ncbi:MAG: hypothetical protein JWP01_1176 [Myxococcales bacterium]|nr:hypothetical protein [Myxococcales bacterium]